MSLSALLDRLRKTDDAAELQHIDTQLDELIGLAIETIHSIREGDSLTAVATSITGVSIIRDMHRADLEQLLIRAVGNAAAVHVTEETSRWATGVTTDGR